MTSFLFHTFLMSRTRTGRTNERASSNVRELDISTSRLIHRGTHPSHLGFMRASSTHRDRPTVRHARERIQRGGANERDDDEDANECDDDANEPRERERERSRASRGWF